MHSPTPCPDAGTLRELLAGHLSEEQQATLADHLETCEGCRKRLEGMAGGDELLSGLRGQPEREESADDTALQEAMARLKAGPGTAETIATPSPDREFSLDILEPSDNPEYVGRLGVYDIIEVVGRGGMGVVLKGHDSKLNRIVAIKVLAPELAANATARKRFLREAQAAAAVTHDHVVTIHAVEESERLPGSVVRLPYLVMEFVSGRSLQERIDQTGPLELREILRIGTQTAAGLAAAHAHGLVHRDIKPANILLENHVERVKITDFGLARAVDDIGMTQTGVVAGTPQYMAPEQARGHFVDHRADLFSLGCVMYAMSTGRSPFRAESTLAVIRRICEDTPRRIQEVNPDIPEWLVRIIDKLLAKDPDTRFQSAAEVAELLGKYLAHVQQPSVVPKPVGLGTEATELFRQPAKRAHGRAWAIAAVLLLLLGGLAVTEATGVTNVREFVATVLRIRTPEGTLVVEVDDPQINVTIDGEEVTLSKVGPHEIRLSPGRHQLQATKDGAPVRSEWVTITRGGKQVVKVGFEGKPEAAAEAAARLPGLARRFLGSHVDPINCVAVSRDGKRLLSGSRDRTVRLWDIPTGKEIRPFLGHMKALCSVALSPDGRHALSGSDDGTVRLWDVETGSEIRRFEGHEGMVRAVAFSPDGRLAATGNAAYGPGYATDRSKNYVRLWEVETGRLIRRCEGFTHAINSLAFSPDGRHVLIGGEDLVGVWDIQTGQTVRRFHDPPFNTASVAFSPDGELAISGHRTLDLATRTWIEDGCVAILWDVKTGRQIRRLRGHTSPVTSVAYSPDGRCVVSGSGGCHSQKGYIKGKDHTVRVWNVETGSELCRFDPGQRVTSVAFLPDGRHVVSGGGQYDKKDNAVLCLWELPENLLSPEQQAAAAAEEASAPPATLTEVRQFEGHTRFIRGLAFFSDGQRAISASDDTTLRVWNVDTGEELRRINTGGIISGSIALSPDEKLVAVGNMGSEGFNLWDVESGEKVRTFEGDSVRAPVYVAFSADGRRILSTSYGDFMARVWDVETGEQISQFQVGKNPDSITFSADGKLAVGDDPDNNTRIWDAATGETVDVLETSDTGMTLRTTISPDGRQALMASQIGVLRLWDVSTGKEIRQLHGHEGQVIDVAFTADGRYIVSGAGADRTMRLWDAATGRELANVPAKTHRFSHVAISADSRYVICGGGAWWGGRKWITDGDYAVHLYRLPESVWPKPEEAGDKAEEGTATDQDAAAKPEAKPDAEPEPQTTSRTPEQVESDTASQIRKLIPDASAISREDFEQLASSPRQPKASDVEEKSLTLMVCALTPKDVEEGQREFRFLVQSPTPAMIGAEFYRRSPEGIEPGGPVTLIHADRITDFTCEVHDNTATGAVSFEAPKLYQGKVNYVARRREDKWQIEEFTMPAYDIHLVRDAKGAWREK
jgi:WD40 repeat protein